MTRIWSTTPDCSALHWDCGPHPADHTDFLEMSGLYASVILTYGIRDGRLILHRHPVFPMLRIFPNNTHGSLQCDIPAEAVPTVLVNRAEDLPRASSVVSDDICGMRLSVEHLVGILTALLVVRTFNKIRIISEISFALRFDSKLTDMLARSITKG